MAEQKQQANGPPRRKKAQAVKIYARIRQLMPWEPNKVSLFIKGKKIQNHTPTTHNEYLFQNTFDTDITNEDIFKTMVRPMVENVLDGFNAILIAYGQTGSGKTYSMLGKPDLNVVGLLPQMLGYVQAQETVKSVELSAVEAFGHHVARIELFDLFDPVNQTTNWAEKKGRTQLDPKKAIKVNITSEMDAHDKIIYAHAGSHFAPTGKNPESSRGHVCFVAKITQQHPEIEHADLISYFVMVDCAGSEGESAFTRDFIASVPANVLMSRRLEAGTINTGLSQLQIIFNELRFKGSLSPMIGNGMRRILHPYINTKTFLSVLFTLSPSVNNAKSTESTLKFAVAAGMVKVKPVKADAQVNLNSLVEQLRKQVQQNEQTIDQQQDEITQLQVDLETAKQEAISAGMTLEAFPSKKKKIRKSRLAREQLNLETLSALPPDVLAQLQQLDEELESSDDEELDEMFVVEADVVESDIQAEMEAALQVMHERTQSVAIIEEKDDESQKLAIEETLALANASVSDITVKREEEGDAEAAGFIDFSEMNQEELNEHQEQTWVNIEDVRTQQTEFRQKLGVIVEQLQQSSPHSAWNFVVIEDIRDALPTD